MRVEQEQIEVARDAWQEGRADWLTMLEGIPAPVQNYIAKRFEAERAELAKMVAKLEAEGKEIPEGIRPVFRITSLSYDYDKGYDSWSVTDNTPGY